MQNCLKCGTKTSVYDTRLTDTGDLRRRRKCPACNYRYSTIEMLDDTNVPVRGPRKPAAEKQPVAKVKPGKPQPKESGGSKKPARLMYDDEEEDYGFSDADVMRDLGIGGTNYE